MSYDSKYSGAVAEQMLDDYVGGKLGGGAKVYDFNMELALQLGAIGQEVYDAIMDADIVTSDDGSLILSKYPSSDGSIKLFASSIEIIDDPQRLTAASIVCTIGADLSVTAQMLTGLIPTKTSELTNDSGFITAADLPPSGGMPTEVIELSSEVALQEGKMLEIDITTPVTGSLSLRSPTIEDPTRGLLFGIRFYCGGSVPQLTLAGGFIGIASIWANGELPQLEPNSLIEILGCRTAGSAVFLLTWAIYKA